VARKSGGTLPEPLFIKKTFHGDAGEANTDADVTANLKKALVPQRGGFASAVRTGGGPYLFPTLRQELGFHARGAHVTRERHASRQDHLPEEEEQHTANVNDVKTTRDCTQPH